MRSCSNSNFILTNGKSIDRLFNDDSLKLLEMILCLKNTGMPLIEIIQFVDWTMNGDETLPQRLEMMKQQKKCSKTNG